MAYETGTASTPIDLLDKLRVFAVARGWTQNRNDSPSGTEREVSLSKGGHFINLKGVNGANIFLLNNQSRHAIALSGSDSYSSGDDWDLQNGYPVDFGTTARFNVATIFAINSGPFPSYHFFSDSSGDYIHCEVEVASGFYQRLGFGVLNLYDPATPGGGRYYYATGGKHVDDSTGSSSWLGVPINDNRSLEEAPFRGGTFGIDSVDAGSLLRVNHPDFNGWASSSISQSNAYTGAAAIGLRERAMLQLSASPLNNTAVLTPINVAADLNNVSLIPFGTVPDMRYMDMTIYQPGDEFSLGPDTWKVFPWYSKGGRSYEFATAYKKIV